MTPRTGIRCALTCATLVGASTCGLFGTAGSSGAAFGQVVQFSTSSSGPTRQSGIEKRDLDLIDSTLSLDQAQREIMQALHAGYSDQYQEESSAHRQHVQSLYQNAGENADWQSIIGKVNAARDRWNVRSNQLNTEFLASVRDILTDDQRTRWPIVERDRRRRALLSGPTRFSGEGVDLIDLVQKLDLEDSQQQAVDPTLNAWADELDALLVARKTAQQRWQENHERQTAQGNVPDPDRMRELRDRVNQQRRAVRDVNLRYAAIIPTQLSQPESSQFTSAFNLATYRSIYGPTAADRYIDAALALPGITTEQEEAIGIIERDYDAQVLQINDQLAAIRRADDEERDEGFAMFGAPGLDFDSGITLGDSGSGVVDGSVGSWVVAHRIEVDTDNGSGAVEEIIGDTSMPALIEHTMPMIIAPGMEPEDPDSPKARFSRSKTELIQRTVNSVHALLTPDQQALAPKPRHSQMLSPEERMRLRMQRALSNMVIEEDGQGNVSVEVRIDEEEPEN